MDLMSIDEALDFLQVKGIERVYGFDEYIRGFLDCARFYSQKPHRITIAEQAYSHFTDHWSWGDDIFPWPKLPEEQTLAALARIIAYIGTDGSLCDYCSEQAAVDRQLNDDVEAQDFEGEQGQKDDERMDEDYVDESTGSQPNTDINDVYGVSDYAEVSDKAPVLDNSSSQESIRNSPRPTRASEKPGTISPLPTETKSSPSGRSSKDPKFWVTNNSNKRKALPSSRQAASSSKASLHTLPAARTALRNTGLSSSPAAKASKQGIDRVLGKAKVGKNSGQRNKAAQKELQEENEPELYGFSKIIDSRLFNRKLEYLIEWTCVFSFSFCPDDHHSHLNTPAPPELIPHVDFLFNLGGLLLTISFTEIICQAGNPLRIWKTTPMTSTSSTRSTRPRMVHRLGIGKDAVLTAFPDKFCLL